MALNLFRFDPLAEFSRLERDLLEDGILTSQHRLALPTTDIFTEGDNTMTVEVHLPTFDEADVTVDIDRGALVIQAEKQEKVEKDGSHGKRYIVRESSQSFYRRIALPDRADASGITAVFENGVLTVTVPFSELPAPQRIPVTTGDRAELGPASPSDHGDQS